MKGPQGRAREVCWVRLWLDGDQPCWVLWAEVAREGLVGVCVCCPQRGDLGRANISRSSYRSGSPDFISACGFQDRVGCMIGLSPDLGSAVILEN